MRDSNENRADIHQEKRIIREEGEKKMLYEQVKANVTTKQAAIRYGLKPDGNGMVQCPFHCDRTPSMKVDERYYCFGCHCTGDVIDFTARLHGLNPKAAAIKLVKDFGIPHVRQRRIRKVVTAESRKTAEENIDTKDKEKLIRDAVRAYFDYNALLKEEKEKFAPRSPEEEDWDDRFCLAVKEMSRVGYYLDILLFETRKEALELAEEKREEVEQIARGESKYERFCADRRFGENAADGSGNGDRSNKTIFRYYDPADGKEFSGKLYQSVAERPAPYGKSAV